jgi:hypothetical protein
LGELQVNLAIEDSRAAMKRSTSSLILAAVSLGLAVGGLPMLLLALAEGIIQLTGADRWLAYGIVAVVALAVSAATVVLAGRKIVKAVEVFNRSKDELTRNLQWLKIVLKQSGRTQHSQSVSLED